MNWMIHERLPVDVTLEHLEQIEPLVIRQNAPCDKKAFCVILDDFWSFCETFGLGRNTTNDFEYYMKQATEIYWQTLQKIPEDLKRTLLAPSCYEPNPFSKIATGLSIFPQNKCEKSKRKMTWWKCWCRRLAPIDDFPVSSAPDRGPIGRTLPGTNGWPMLTPQQG